MPQDKVQLVYQVFLIIAAVLVGSMFRVDPFYGSEGDAIRGDVAVNTAEIAKIHTWQADAPPTPYKLLQDERFKGLEEKQEARFKSLEEIFEARLKGLQVQLTHVEHLLTREIETRNHKAGSLKSPR